MGKRHQPIKTEDHWKIRRERIPIKEEKKEKKKRRKERRKGDWQRLVRPRDEKRERVFDLITDKKKRRREENNSTREEEEKERRRRRIIIIIIGREEKLRE